MRATALVSLAVLSGCVSAPPPPVEDFTHAQLTGPAAERQGAIDNAECEAIVPNRAAESKEYDPSLAAYPTYAATAKDTSAPSSIISGYEAVAEAEGGNREFNEAVAVAVRNNLVDACLMRRGWSKETEAVAYAPPRATGVATR
jgi:hypothetical protein